MKLFLYALALFLASCGLTSPVMVAQTTPQPVSPGRAVSITLQDAIARSRTANNAVAAAQTIAGVAEAQRRIARAALLPTAVYHNQVLYTQAQKATTSTVNPTGTTTSPVRFVANNVVHEYISQGVATELIGGTSVTTYLRSGVDLAIARAQLEIANRGLVATTVSTFYSALSADAKVAIAQRAREEAQRFAGSTQLRENGGEVAHADVVRADLQTQQRERELNEAVLLANRSKLDLGVLLFSDPSTPYSLDASLDQLPPLPSAAEMERTARQNNPYLNAALEQVHFADLEVIGAYFAYLPDLGLNFSYGIDAPQFAITGPDGVRNLGYAISANLDIPIWDWLATHQRIRQSQFRRNQARTQLSVAQRQLIASLRQFYDEAKVSRQQLTLLDRSLDTAQEVLRLVNLRYAAGEGTVLEVVDAQTSLVLAQSSRADGEVRYFLALANLQTLTGNLP